MSITQFISARGDPLSNTGYVFCQPVTIETSGLLKYSFGELRQKVVSLRSPTTCIPIYIVTLLMYIGT